MNEMECFLCWLHVKHFLWSFAAETSKEVCFNEGFSGQCQYDEVIMVTKALYGHVKQGRCAPRDFGHFGCFNDVTQFMDAKCSGARNCQVPLNDVASANEIPECAKSLVTYLEISYVCIKGDIIYS